VCLASGLLTAERFKMSETISDLADVLVDFSTLSRTCERFKHVATPSFERAAASSLELRFAASFLSLDIWSFQAESEGKAGVFLQDFSGLPSDFRFFDFG